MNKIQLNEQIQTLSVQMSETRKIIKQKYNLNIQNQMKRLEIEQETKILKFLAAYGKSKAL